MLFVHIIYSLSIFCLGRIKTLYGNAPEFGTIFRAFIVHETPLICLSMLRRFEVTRFRLMEVVKIWGFFPTDTTATHSLLLQ